MILVFSATSASNLDLAKNVTEILAEQKKDFIIIDLEQEDLPLFSPSKKASGIPDRVIEITEQAKQATGFMFFGPEYNGSLPPCFSNTIAWISTSGDKDWRSAFNGKMTLLGTSSGGAGLKFQSAMTQQLHHIGAVVLPRMISINASKPYNPETAQTITKQFLSYLKSS